MSRQLLFTTRLSTRSILQCLRLHNQMGGGGGGGGGGGQTAILHVLIQLSYSACKSVLLSPAFVGVAALATKTNHRKLRVCSLHVSQMRGIFHHSFLVFYFFPLESDVVGCGGLSTCNLFGTVAETLASSLPPPPPPPNNNNNNKHHRLLLLCLQNRSLSPYRNLLSIRERPGNLQRS